LDNIVQGSVVHFARALYLIRDRGVARRFLKVAEEEPRYASQYKMALFLPAPNLSAIDRSLLGRLSLPIATTKDYRIAGDQCAIAAIGGNGT
jgi:hypothetical protein